MKYFIIGDEDAVLGFSMAGVDGIIAENPQEVEAAFHQAVSDKENGIIIITQGRANMIREKIKQYIFSEKFPLIVEIPGRKTRKGEGKSLRELANEAIGIKL